MLFAPGEDIDLATPVNRDLDDDMGRAAEPIQAEAVAGSGLALSGRARNPITPAHRRGAAWKGENPDGNG